MIRQLNKFVAPLKRRVMLMFGRGVVRMINNGLKMQALQITLLNGETRANVERFQDYGVSSHPLPGAEVVYGCVGGNRDHVIALKVDDRRYRPTDGEPGEVIFYTDEDQGGPHRIHFKRGREIHMKSGPNSLVITPAGVTITTNNFDLNYL